MTPIERLRAIALALPEAQEKPFGDQTAPTFRVRDKMFVYVFDDERSLMMKAPAGEQEALVAHDPDRFFRPPYLGGKGWIGVTLRDDLDWEEVAEMVEESYRMIAPKRLHARI